MQDWVQEIWLDGASNGAPNVASGQHASWADRTRTLEFRGLRYFVSVARTGTFAAAAQELNVSQVTITRSIQRLEEAVGVKLLTRHGRGASLTSIGSRLAVRLETVLQSVISAAEESPGPTVRGGGLSIALSPEVGLLLAPALLKQCHPRWPLIRLDVREVATDMLADCVLRGLADVAIVQDGISSGNVIVEQVLSERLGLVAAPRHLAAQNAAAVRFRDLLGLPLILPTSQHPNRRRLTKAAYQRGINLNVVSEVDSVPLAKTLVRNELGCAILPRMAVQEELARGALVFRDIEFPALVCTHGIASRLDPARGRVTNVVSLIRKSIASLVNCGMWPGVSQLHAPELSTEPGPNAGRALSRRRGI